jgi:serine/threonine-protein kinase
MSSNDSSTPLAGRYRLGHELGRGGTATVYLAVDLKHGRDVAVKILHPELAHAIGPARFAREIEIAARLAHPHILTLIDSGEADGSLFYVTPFVDGQSLRQRLERDRKLPLIEAVRIVEQVASALSHAHTRGVIHRDVKPENILLSGDQAIVADFGIARAVEWSDDQRLTSIGLVVGTAAYASPEQAAGHGDVDGRSDVYSLGCVLFEMLTGRTPFVAPDARRLLARHVLDEAPALRTVDPDQPLYAERALDQALAKDPARRFATPNALASVLRSATVVAPTRRKRLAVLVPRNLRNEPDREFLVLGLHEALISHLGQNDVAVLARTSVLQYERTDKPARTICRELEVDSLIESSLIVSGDSISVQARLIDGETEECIWSRAFDGDAANVPSLYRNLAAAVAAEARGMLAPRSGRHPYLPAVASLAYERYMRGRVLQQTFGPQAFEQALAYYASALEAQPNYAPAFAGIALVWGSRAVLGITPAAEAEQHWRGAAQRAVELDPDLAEGHQALGQVYTWYHYDWARAEGSFRRALELDPSEPQTRIFYSHFLAMMQRTAESDAQIRRALEIDPFNPFTQLLYGIQRWLTGRFEEAFERLATVPANPLRSSALAHLHLAQGELADGLAHYAEYFELLGDRDVGAVLRDSRTNPKAAMRRAADLLVDRSDRTFVKPNNIVYLYAWGDDLDHAIDWLERAYRLHDHEVAYFGAIASPATPLHGDPRFHAFLGRLGLSPPSIQDGAAQD